MSPVQVKFSGSAHASFGRGPNGLERRRCFFLWMENHLVVCRMDTVGWTFIQHLNDLNDLVLYIRMFILFPFASAYWLEKDIDLHLAKATLNCIASRCTPKQLTRDYFAETLVLITFSESKYLVYLF